MIDVAQLTEQTFKTIMGRIHVLVSKKAVRLACSCIDTLISKRLMPLEDDDWLAQAFITRLWATVHDKTSRGEDSIEDLNLLLDKLTKQLSKPLSKTATHAAQILLWRVSETFYLQEKYDLSSKWCRVALHKVFDRSGELNLAKISRWVAILCFGRQVRRRRLLTSIDESSCAPSS